MISYSQNFRHIVYLFYLQLIDNQYFIFLNYWYVDGSQHVPQHWFELAKEHWTQAYRLTGTPCSCWMCRGNEYDRLAYKRDTHRIIRESMD